MIQQMLHERTYAVRLSNHALPNEPSSSTAGCVVIRFMSRSSDEAVRRADLVGVAHAS